MATDEERAQEWSDLHGRAPEVRYDPSEAADRGLTKTEYTDAYLRAFVTCEHSPEARRTNANEANLRHWYVDIKQHTQAAEYDEKYS